MRNFCILLLGFLSSFHPVFAHNFDCTIDSVPAIKDTLHHRLYVSIASFHDVTVQHPVSVKATDTDDLTDVCWNGNPVGSLFPITLREGHPADTLSFRISPDSVAQWTVVYTPLPVVELTLDHLENLTKNNPAKGIFRIADFEARTEDSRDFTSPLIAYYRGATARNFPKKSFSLCFYDEAQNDRDVDVLDIRSDQKWIMDAMAVDSSRMRNRLCFDLWNEVSGLANERMKRNGTKGYHVEVVLNGKYHGVYCLTDKVNRKLLGIRKSKPEQTIESHGSLYKCQSADTPTCHLILKDEEYDTDGMKWADWELKYPNLNLHDDTYKPLIDLMHFTTRVETDAEFVDAHLKDYFYEDNLLDYTLFSLSMMLIDNCMHNTYLSFYLIPEDSRAWITPWDMDGSFGRDGVGNLFDHLAASWNVFQHTEPFMTLFDQRDNSYFRKLAERWHVLREQQFSVAHVAQQIDHYATLLTESGAWQRERERWNGEMTPLAATPEAETTYMKQWYRRNFDMLDSYFYPPSAIQSLDLTDGTSANPAVYTLDGRQVQRNQPIHSLPKGLYIVNGQKVIR